MLTQLWVWLMLAALALGVVSAALEKTRAKTAQVCMVLCGLLFTLAAQEPGMRDDIAQVWGYGAARNIPTVLLLVGDILMVVAVYWAAKSLWDDYRQKRGEK